ncbi:hypothetical protein BpHYR1_040413 [Brachionus plicatilis]|uniref:Uncharacterized protein n=1 Tax=Brachionus plicatilis TaxID=10195 RepID=A0A3M7PQN5_BRAPC|nr:hypothetical protein BpHYR1_040413 [Brachionus plicatilis]
MIMNLRHLSLNYVSKLKKKTNLNYLNNAFSYLTTLINHKLIERHCKSVFIYFFNLSFYHLVANGHTLLEIKYSSVCNRAFRRELRRI